MEAITKAEAIARGLKRYYTGKPCKHGHVAERYVSGQCVACDLDGKRAAYQKNPEKFKARALETYRRNPAATIARNKKWVSENHDRAKAAVKAWYSANLQRVRESRSAYLAKPGRREMARAAVRDHYGRNKPYYMVRSAAKRARKARAMPPWFGDLDALVWREAAHLVQLRSTATGIPWHADHMIPLACRTACGLHVWNNCQVIPACINKSKGNNLIFTNPGEWIATSKGKP